MPLTRTLGIRALRFEPDGVVLQLDWAESLTTSGGLLHGGAVMALADSAGGACAFLNLPQGAVGTSTIESGTHFLGGVTAGTLTASSRCLHKGRTTIVVETELTTDTGKVVGKTTQTQAVLMPRS
jgi:uncharacterized protein (TIGR00369 family)